MNNRRTAIATMFALYGLVAFVTTLAAPLATVWKARPEIAGLTEGFDPAEIPAEIAGKKHLHFQRCLEIMFSGTAG